MACLRVDARASGIVHPRGVPGSTGARADVKIASAAAHFHGFGVARQGPWCTVEKRPLCPLWPQIGHQTRQFWGVSSSIRGRTQLDADFFNRLAPSTHFVSKGKKTQRSLPRCLSEPFAGIMRRTRGLSEADSWFEGSCAPRLTPRTDSTFLSRAASPPQPHQNPLQIAFQPIYRRFSWFERSRLVV